MNQREQAEHFAHLHVEGKPLILVNVWDAGSAKVIAAAGAKAIATGSASVAAAHGFEDRELLPLDLVLANLILSASSRALPYLSPLTSKGGTGKALTRWLKRSRKYSMWAQPINIEDQIIGGEGRYSVSEQCQRIGAVRDVADKSSIPLFINARTDIYLQANPKDHGEKHLAEAVGRAKAYAQAGADGFFVPGLRDPQGHSRPM